jgi:hypothetical protein
MNGHGLSKSMGRGKNQIMGRTFAVIVIALLACVLPFTYTLVSMKLEQLAAKQKQMNGRLDQCATVNTFSAGCGEPGQGCAIGFAYATDECKQLQQELYNVGTRISRLEHWISLRNSEKWTRLWDVWIE